MSGRGTFAPGLGVPVHGAGDSRVGSVSARDLWSLHELLWHSPHLAEHHQLLLDRLPSAMRRDPDRLHEALARMSALARLLSDPTQLAGWRQAGREDGTVSVVVDVIDIAAICPLLVVDGAPAFDAATFADLLLESVQTCGAA